MLNFTRKWRDLVELAKNGNFCVALLSLYSTSEKHEYSCHNESPGGKTAILDRIQGTGRCSSHKEIIFPYLCGFVELTWIMETEVSSGDSWRGVSCVCGGDLPLCTSTHLRIQSNSTKNLQNTLSSLSQISHW